ncbi:3-dehydro-L-gulonate 2-dehydrogenase [Paenibacillus cremeus]|uniref:3-dehydro-L-gulonate 2-dehydrogenase n=1 Tax=Paenibacillus cremeus TaxID=2163881 RepID=A0A559JDE8_9BACL|nr:3-dehydro-L-gulonate 2-dehydrogenase [Paenibacillus cremeus]
MRIPYAEMYGQFLRVLLKEGFTTERAELCAKLFAEASRDGVYTHGLNRFPRFIEHIRRGVVDIHAHPKQEAAYGALERWDGSGGPGNLNAYFCMNRAIDLAGRYGMGAVSLSNTNHWMRAGAYGWQAAEAGCIGMCWTNTTPNLPPWGSAEAKLGNNPIVLAVPRQEGHVVLDMAMSMFSYGKLETYHLQNKPLPVDGGFDQAGELSRDPGAILESKRPLPIGYWKGSGLSLLLDMIAAVLSGGLATHEIGRLEQETRVSQMFIAFDASKLDTHHAVSQTVNSIIEDLAGAEPLKENEKVYYPGERTLFTRAENMAGGIPAEPIFWEQVLAL